MDEGEVFQEHIIVDLTDCKYVMEFWKRIQDSFDFGESFGKNWDAFSDVLRRECPAKKATLIGVNTLPKDWKSATGIPFADMIHRILQKNKAFKERYQYEFEYEFIDV